MPPRTFFFFFRASRRLEHPIAMPTGWWMVLCCVPFFRFFVARNPTNQTDRQTNKQWPRTAETCTRIALSCLPFPFQALSRRGFGELSTAETLALLRWLSDILMDSPAVRGKVSEHADRLSRLSMGDRKKAEAEDRAIVESLGVGQGVCCKVL